MAMAETEPTEEQAVVNNNNKKEEEEESEEEEEPYYSSSDDEDGGGGPPGRATAAGGGGGYSSSEEEGEGGDNSPEANFRKFSKALDDPYLKRAREREERNVEHPEELFDFPRDPENWQEEDLREHWADGPVMSGEPGWDPVWADEEEWEMVKDEIKRGNDPPIAPFYVPYRKFYPVIPDNHFDIDNPKAAIEELDRIEEFLKWVSFVFADGSTYEGTVWDDLAHGKGVYVADEGLVRYEGEWLRNLMEGHGVVEVEVPGVEPVPGSKLEAKMRAQGRIISRDFKSPGDKKWLEMDIEDTVLLAGGRREIPFYEREAWVKVFGQKPEKGRYRYAGQWKHGRMHGCGVYEVNERIIYGRFYFGDHLEDSTGCDSNVSALHAGIAEVAAAKARMFINKPDGMVREERGPYGDPQHPYFYEEDDVWMAPGFVNQFYEVPDYWKTYVQEVDQEREMWLNSFHKAPLRIPMPAELEYWWSQDQGPEFVLINKEPEPDPEDPSNLIYTEDPLIVHTPTGRLINYVEDEEHGVRLFWQPHLEEGEDVDPEKAEFLPLGFDEFYGRTAPGEKKESKFKALITAIENALKPLFERLDNWVEDKRKASELKRKLIDAELELIEAEICLEEALEDRENELKMKQKEEEKRAAAVKDSDQVSGEGAEYDADSEDEDEDDGAPTSFGTVQQAETDKSENKSAKSPFSSLTLSVASPGLISMVSSKLQNSFLSWEKARYRPSIPDVCSNQNEMILMGDQRKSISVTFPSSSRGRANLKVVQRFQLPRRNNGSKLRPLARILSSEHTRRSSEINHGSNGAPHNLSILSLHVPVDICTLS